MQIILATFILADRGTAAFRGSTITVWTGSCSESAKPCLERMELVVDVRYDACRLDLDMLSEELILSHLELN
jgi:hypothetical protein